MRPYKKWIFGVGGMVNPELSSPRIGFEHALGIPAPGRGASRARSGPATRAPPAAGPARPLTHASGLAPQMREAGGSRSR